MANGLFGGGDGTADNPYLVEDAADLDAVRNDLTACYKQTKDIDLVDFGNWEPIGHLVAPNYDQYFSGIYDGSNNLITNMKFFLEETLAYFPPVGIFGSTKGAKIVNTHLRDVNIYNGSSSYTGALLGAMDVHTRVVSCSSSGNIYGRRQSGGLVGLLMGKCEKSYSVAKVSGANVVAGLFSASNDLDTTGVVFRPEISNCYFDGDLTLSGASSNIIGGLIPFARGVHIENSYSAGKVVFVGADMSHFGGLVGSLSSTSTSTSIIENSYSLTTEIDFQGGLLRDASSGDIADQVSGEYQINNCYGLSTMISNFPITRNSTALITPEDAKTKAHYVANGWDFENIWDIKEGETYPFFKKIIPVVKCKAIPMGKF